MSKKICFDLDQLPHCCGAYEMGNLQVAENLVYREHEVSLKNRDKVISKIQDLSDGRPVHVNFVQNRDEDSDEYECQEFLDILVGHPDVVDLGTWINPGSGNRIHAFMIKGNME